MAKRKIIIKIISITLSVLLVWQAVVWADPGVFNKNTLSPRLLFSSPSPEDAFFHMASSYFGFFLSGAEDKLEFQNVTILTETINKELARLKNSDDVPEAYKEQLPEEAVYDPITASVTIDFGTSKIRYFNHHIRESAFYFRDGAESEYNVVEKKIGRYLTRQIITQKSVPEETFHENVVEPETEPKKQLVADNEPQIDSDTVKYDLLSGLKKLTEVVRNKLKEKDRIVILITGKSAAGKTWLSKQLEKGFAGVDRNDIVHIEHDVVHNLMSLPLNLTFNEVQGIFNRDIKKAQIGRKIVIIDGLYASKNIGEGSVIKNPDITVVMDTERTLRVKRSLRDMINGRRAARDIYESEDDEFDVGHPEELLIITNNIPVGVLKRDIQKILRPGEEVFIDRIKSFFKDLLGVGVKNLWYNRPARITLPRDFIENELNEIVKMAPEISNAAHGLVWEQNLRNINVPIYVEALDVFQDMLSEKRMTVGKMERYIDRYHSYMERGAYKLRYIFFVLPFFKTLLFYKYWFRYRKVKRVLKRMLSRGMTGQIEKDPVRHASEVFVGVVKTQAFHQGNHRIAALLLNYILVKNGLPYFVLTRENVFRYYQLLNTSTLQSNNYDMDEIISFFTEQINKAKERGKTTKYKSFAGAKSAKISDLSYLEKNDIASFIRTLDDYTDKYNEFFSLDKQTQIVYAKDEKGVYFYAVLKFDQGDCLVETMELDQRMNASENEKRKALEEVYKLVARKGYRDIYFDIWIKKKRVVWNNSFFSLIRMASVHGFGPRGNQSAGISLYKVHLNDAFIEKETGKDSFGPALFYDYDEGRTRELNSTTNSITGEVDEHAGLNGVLKNIIFDSGKKSNYLKSNVDPLVQYVREQDPEVDIYVIKDELLQQELDRIGLNIVGKGLITHAGTYQGRHNLFLPKSVYDLFMYLLRRRGFGLFAESTLDEWRDHELGHIKDRGTNTDLDDEYLNDLANQIIYVGNALRDMKKGRFGDALEGTKTARNYAPGVGYIPELEAEIHMRRKDWYNAEGSYFEALLCVNQACVNNIWMDHPIEDMVLGMSKRTKMRYSDLLKKTLDYVKHFEYWYRTRNNVAINKAKYQESLMTAIPIFFKLMVRISDKGNLALDLENEFMKKMVSLAENDMILHPKRSEEVPYDKMKSGIFYSMGYFNLQKKKVDEAIKFLEKAVEINPDNSVVKLVLITAYIEKGTEEYVKRGLDLLIETDKFIDEHFKDAPKYQDFKDRVRLLFKAAQETTECIEVYKLADELFEFGDYQGCWTLIDEHANIRIFPKNLPVEKLKRDARMLDKLKKKALAAVEDSKYDKALAYAEKIIEVNQHDGHMRQVMQMISAGREVKRIKEEANSSEEKVPRASKGEKAFDGIRNLIAQAESFRLVGNAEKARKKYKSALKAIQKQVTGDAGLLEKIEEGLKWVQDQRTKQKEKRFVDQRIRDNFKKADEILPIAKRQIKTGRLGKARRKLNELKGIVDSLVNEDALTLEQEGKFDVLVDEVVQLEDELGSMPGVNGNGSLEKSSSFCKIDVYITPEVLDKLKNEVGRTELPKITRAIRLMALGYAYNKRKMQTGFNLWRRKTSGKWRIFYTTLENGNRLIVDVDRRDGNTYSSIGDRFSDAKAYDALMEEAVLQQEGLKSLEESTLKAPFSDALDEDDRLDHAYIKTLINNAKEKTDQVNVPACIEYINSNAPPIDGKDISDINIKMFAVAGLDDSFGLPRFMGARKAKDLIYAYPVYDASKKELRLYMTSKFLELLSKTPLLLAEVIDHEYHENVLGYPHRVASSRSRSFVSSKGFLSEFHQFYIDRILSEKELHASEGLIPNRTASVDINDAYNGDEAKINDIENYEHKLFIYLRLLEFIEKAGFELKKRKKDRDINLLAELALRVYKLREKYPEIKLSPDREKIYNVILPERVHASEFNYFRKVEMPLNKFSIEDLAGYPENTVFTGSKFGKRAELYSKGRKKPLIKWKKEYGGKQVAFTIKNGDIYRLWVLDDDGFVIDFKQMGQIYQIQNGEEIFREKFNFRIFSKDFQELDKCVIKDHRLGVNGTLHIGGNTVDFGDRYSMCKVEIKTIEGFIDSVTILDEYGKIIKYADFIRIYGGPERKELVGTYYRYLTEEIDNVTLKGIFLGEKGALFLGNSTDPIPFFAEFGGDEVEVDIIKGHIDKVRILSGDGKVIKEDIFKLVYSIEDPDKVLLSFNDSILKEDSVKITGIIKRLKTSKTCKKSVGVLEFGPFAGRERTPFTSHVEKGKIISVQFFEDIECTRPLGKPKEYSLIYDSENKLIDSFYKQYSEKKRKKLKKATVKKIWLDKKGFFKFGGKYWAGFKDFAKHEIEFDVENGVVVRVRIFKEDGSIVPYEFKKIYSIGAKGKEVLVDSFWGVYSPENFKKLDNHAIKGLTLTENGVLDVGGRVGGNNNMPRGVFPNDPGKEVAVYVKNGEVEKVTDTNGVILEGAIRKSDKVEGSYSIKQKGNIFFGFNDLLENFIDRKGEDPTAVVFTRQDFIDVRKKSRDPDSPDKFSYKTCAKELEDMIFMGILEVVNEDIPYRYQITSRYLRAPPEDIDVVKEILKPLPAGVTAQQLAFARSKIEKKAPSLKIGKTLPGIIHYEKVLLSYYILTIKKFNLDLIRIYTERANLKKHPLRPDVNERAEALQANLDVLVGRLTEEIEYLYDAEYPEDINISRNYRAEAREKLRSAKRNIEGKNEPAACASFWSAVNILTEEMMVLSKSFKRSGSVLSWRDRRETIFKTVKGQYVTHTLKDDKEDDEVKRTVRVKERVVQKSDTLWQALRARDREHDSMLDELDWLNFVLDELGKTITVLQDKKDNLGSIELTVWEREQVKDVLEKIRKKLRRKDSDKISVPEKIVASTASKYALELLEMGEYGNMFEMVKVLNSNLDVRKVSLEGMIKSVSSGRLKSLRHMVHKRNSWCVFRTEKLEEALEKGDIQEALKWCYSLLKDKQIRNEPEFFGMTPLIGQIETKLKKNVDFSTVYRNLDIIRQRAALMELVDSFMESVRDEYVNQRLLGTPQAIYGDIFREKFNLFLKVAKEKNIGRGSPRLIHVAFYLASFVKLQKKDPELSSKKVPNPLFTAMLHLVRFLEINSITLLEESVLNRRQKSFPNIYSVVKSFKDSGSTSLDSLNFQDHRRLVDAFGVDFDLTGSDKYKMLKALMYAPIYQFRQTVNDFLKLGPKTKKKQYPNIFSATEHLDKRKLTNINTLDLSHKVDLVNAFCMDLKLDAEDKKELLDAVAGSPVERFRLLFKENQGISWQQNNRQRTGYMRSDSLTPRPDDNYLMVYPSVELFKHDPRLGVLSFAGGNFFVDRNAFGFINVQFPSRTRNGKSVLRISDINLSHSFSGIHWEDIRIDSANIEKLAGILGYKKLAEFIEYTRNKKKDFGKIKTVYGFFTSLEKYADTLGFSLADLKEVMEVYQEEYPYRMKDAPDLSILKDIARLAEAFNCKNLDTFIWDICNTIEIINGIKTTEDLFNYLKGHIGKEGYSQQQLEELEKTYKKVSEGEYLKDDYSGWIEASLQEIARVARSLGLEVVISAEARKVREKYAESTEEKPSKHYDGGAKWPHLRKFYSKAGPGIIGQALVPSLVESGLFVGVGSWLIRSWVGLPDAFSFGAVMIVAVFQLVWHLLHGSDRAFVSSNINSTLITMIFMFIGKAADPFGWTFTMYTFASLIGAHFIVNGMGESPAEIRKNIVTIESYYRSKGKLSAYILRGINRYFLGGKAKRALVIGSGEAKEVAVFSKAARHVLGVQSGKKQIDPDKWTVKGILSRVISYLTGLKQPSLEEYPSSNIDKYQAGVENIDKLKRMNCVDEGRIDLVTVQDFLKRRIDLAKFDFIYINWDVLSEKDQFLLRDFIKRKLFSPDKGLMPGTKIILTSSDEVPEIAEACDEYTGSTLELPPDFTVYEVSDRKKDLRTEDEVIPEDKGEDTSAVQEEKTKPYMSQKAKDLLHTWRTFYEADDLALIDIYYDEDSFKVPIEKTSETQNGAIFGETFTLDLLKVCEYFIEGKSLKVLDAGSGNAKAVAFMSKYADHVTGVEIDSKDITASEEDGLLEAGKDRIEFLAQEGIVEKSKITLRAEDFLDEDFDFSEYDLVYMYWMHTKEDTEKYLKLIQNKLLDKKKGLKPGATLVVNALPKEVKFEKLEEMDLPREKKGFPQYIRAYTRADDANNQLEEIEKYFKRIRQKTHNGIIATDQGFLYSGSSTETIKGICETFLTAKTKKVIDMGSGRGKAVAVFSHFADEVTGIELDSSNARTDSTRGLFEESVENIKTLDSKGLVDGSKIKLVDGDYLNPHISLSSYDLVYLYWPYEAKDDQEYIKLLQGRLLSPGGLKPGALLVVQSHRKDKIIFEGLERVRVPTDNVFMQNVAVFRMPVVDYDMIGHRREKVRDLLKVHGVKTIQELMELAGDITERDMIETIEYLSKKENNPVAREVQIAETSRVLTEIYPYFKEVVSFLSGLKSERAITRFYIAGSFARGWMRIRPKDIDIMISLKQSRFGAPQDVFRRIESFFNNINKRSPIGFHINMLPCGPVYKVEGAEVVPTQDVREEDMYEKHKHKVIYRLIDITELEKNRAFYGDNEFFGKVYRSIATDYSFPLFGVLDDESKRPTVLTEKGLFERFRGMEIYDKAGRAYEIENDGSTTVLNIYDTLGEHVGYVDIYFQEEGIIVVGDAKVFPSFENRGIHSAFFKKLGMMTPEGYAVDTVLKEEGTLEYLNSLYHDEKLGVDKQGFLKGYDPEKCKMGHIYFQSGFKKQHISVTRVNGDLQFQLYAFRSDEEASRVKTKKDWIRLVYGKYRTDEAVARGILSVNKDDLLSTSNISTDFNKGFRKRTVEEMVKRLPAGARVLSVGVGSGVFEGELVEAGFSVTGVDLAPNLLALAQEKGIEVIEADAEEPEFWARQDLREKFDAVIFVESMRYMDQPEEVLAMARKVLKKEGIVCILRENTDKSNYREHLEKAGYNVTNETLAFEEAIWTIFAEMPGDSWSLDQIIKNAKEEVINPLVEFLVRASVLASSKNSEEEKNLQNGKKDKVALLLDSELSFMTSRDISKEIERLIKIFTDINGNNRELAVFLDSLEILPVKGSTVSTREGLKDYKNIIAVTKASNRSYFESINKNAIVASIQDENFPKDAYLPMLEVTLFAIGKYLGLSQEELLHFYRKIPNAKSPDELKEDGEYFDLFDKTARSIIIQLPHAKSFKTPKSVVETMAIIRDLLSKA